MALTEGQYKALNVVKRHGSSVLASKTRMDTNEVHRRSADSLIANGVLVKFIGPNGCEMVRLAPPPPETDPWKAEFKKRLVDAIIKNGSPLRRDGDRYYGWMDYNWQEINATVSQIGVDYADTTWVESVWYEFMGTFYEGDNRKYGIDMTLRLLNGGEYLWRYSGSVSDLILAVVNE